MKDFGVQYSNKTNTKKMGDYTGETKSVLAVLKKLNEGYAKKNPELADEYLKACFVMDDSVYLLGTASEELCPGVAEVKDLLESDWEYWGDAAFVLDEAIITVKDDLAWFSTPATVKYSFEHTQKRYDGYVDFIKEKANDISMSPEKRISFINWAMTLTYHQRNLDKRDYYCAMRFSGVMIKKDGSWQISSGHFSMPKGVFADHRIESSQLALEDFNTDKEAFKTYQEETLSTDVATFIKEFSKDCFGNKSLTTNHVDNYFSKDENTHIISPDTEWFIGRENILEFLQSCGNSEVTLETSSAIGRTINNCISVTGVGMMKQVISKEVLADRALKALNELFESEKPSQQKLFELHRQVAYVLNESADGDEFTCPIRYSMIISKLNGKRLIEQIHFSYPFDWIFEGKLDTI